MKTKLLVVVKRITLVAMIAEVLFGKRHRPIHRMTVGVVVMALGVGIAKSTGHLEPFPLAMAGDMVGYAVHGLGLTPFLEKLLVMFDGE